MSPEYKDRTREGRRSFYVKAMCDEPDVFFEFRSGSPDDFQENRQAVHDEAVKHERGRKGHTVTIEIG